MPIFDFFKRDKDKDKEKKQDREKGQEKDKEENQEKDNDQSASKDDKQITEKDAERIEEREKEKDKETETSRTEEKEERINEETKNIEVEIKDKNEETGDKKEEARQDRFEQEGAEQDHLEQDRVKQGGSEQDQVKQDQVDQDKVKQDQAEQDEADRILQDEEEVDKGFFQRLKEGLARSRQGFVDKVSSVFSRSKIDEEFYEELEETLIQADVGVKATLDLISDLEQEVEEQEITEPEELYQVFQEKIRNILGENDQVLKPWEGLKVLMIVGVNGAGKTTTIAKLAHRYQKQGKKVLLAAGDTFRAGAIDQIKEWGRRLNTDVISQSEGADAAAVAYDAVQAANSREADLLIVDTAGRLHTQKNLMEELKKVRRVIGREAGEEAVEVMLVVDATTGQNALNQAKIFNEAVSIDGITLTKLDGTARGGIVLAIKKELGLPIRLIGVGERAADLQDFDPEKFVEALFSSN